MSCEKPSKKEEKEPLIGLAQGFAFEEEGALDAGRRRARAALVEGDVHATLCRRGVELLDDGAAVLCGVNIQHAAQL